MDDPGLDRNGDEGERDVDEEVRPGDPESEQVRRGVEECKDQVRQVDEIVPSDEPDVSDSSLPVRPSDTLGVPIRVGTP